MTGEPDLSFILHGVHRRLLAEELTQALPAGVLGFRVGGSVARGTARPTSDLDLWLYWPQARPFETEERAEILIERHGHTLERAWREVEEGSDLTLLGWAESRVLHDPGGDLARIQAEVRRRLAAYCTPEAERRRLRHWLTSTLGKLEGAAPDQATFLTRTTLWTLAEALCAVNDHSPPAVTRMWELLPELPIQPQGDWLARLLSGQDEVQAFREVAGWVLVRL
ncbi:nucleotidyltransferase domain-containing protein [Deinococcus terrestris]|uniref:nucleotidyltransferase domain-containing protein n=1 Tax=Deinococcus terrestris TaxID=2651870 RepID=UPI0018833EF8|nr:nucleotidyltransferase domain-containing protein [Deinococcus terrestris]